METFNVTQDHIDSGQPVSASSCPVALSIQEKYPDVVVDGTSAGVGGYYDVDSAIKWVKLPNRVTAFISDFDAGRAVKPIAFQIKVPPQWGTRDDR